MSGVSGIGGGGGPSRISSENNNKKKQKVTESSLGGHSISSQSSSPSEDSISACAQTRIHQNSGIQSPRHSEGSSGSVTPGGWLQRLLGSFGRLCARMQRTHRGESVGHQGDTERGVRWSRQGGVRLPEAEAIQKYFQSRGIHPVDASGEESPADVSGPIVRVPIRKGFFKMPGTEDPGEGTNSSQGASSVKSKRLGRAGKAAKSASPKGAAGSPGSRLAARLQVTWQKYTHKPQGPLDPHMMMNVTELRGLSENYRKMADLTEDPTEKKQMLKLAGDCEKRAGLLERAGVTRSTQRGMQSIQEDSTSSFSDRVRADATGEGIFLDEGSARRLSDSSLSDHIRSGRRAEEDLRSVDASAQEVFAAIEGLERQVGEGDLAPSARARMQASIDRLREGVLAVLRALRTFLLGLIRLIRNGCVALGEAVSRCCRRQGDSDRWYVFYTHDTDGDSGADREELRNEIQQSLENASADLTEGEVLIVGDVVQAWSSGSPEITEVDDMNGGNDPIYEDLDGFRDPEGDYEEITSVPTGYEVITAVPTENPSEGSTPVRGEEPIYAVVLPKWLRGRNPNIDGDPTYDVPRNYNDSIEEPIRKPLDPVYDTPRVVVTDHVPIYDVPRNQTKNPEPHYMSPRQYFFGTSPGYGAAVAGVTLLNTIDLITNDLGGDSDA